MNKHTIFYWTTTALAVAGIATSGLVDLLALPEVMEAFAALGYPAYLATLLGVWKIAGAVAIAAPGLPRLKEWAYAGIFFDLTGASFSHAASGDTLDKVLTPLFLLAIVATSWALRPTSRRWPTGDRTTEAPARDRKDALAPA